MASGAAFDEEKCRNVLVRYCAHIPRNYQYRDGIQQIFLIMREHLGDENLGLAGGVLYELIEIDCGHTDDAGAAFQRWRHHHMGRYRDLELPHVPHMTTITSPIIPTERLAQWRSGHPERYPFVLSDSLPPWERPSAEHGCIRTRKAWLIENTFYVSSRDGRTFPLHTPSPKEFHEMQWLLQHDTVAEVVDERETSAFPSACPSDKTPREAAPKTSTASFEESFRESSPRSSLLNKFVTRISREKKQPEQEQRRQSWLLGALTPDSSPTALVSDDADANTTVPLPDGCQVPNAIFARKHLLSDTGPLPPQLSIKQMPVAESKATDTLVEAASSGLLHKEQDWYFRGPFTPQLGYDGGLDYRWVHTGLDPSRFTFEPVGVHPKDTELRDKHDNHRLSSSPPPIATTPRTKRKAFYFGLDSARNWFINHHRPITPPHTLSSVTKASNPDQVQKTSQNVRCLCSISKDKATDPLTSPPCGQQNTRRKWRSPLQLDSVEFMTPAGPHGKAAVVQAPPPTLPALRGLPPLQMT